MTEQRMVDVKFLRRLSGICASHKYHASVAEIGQIIDSPNVGWQPIETAPKDGTDILIYTKSGGMYVVAYDDAWANPWRVLHEGGLNTWAVIYWMPLPQPPKED